MSDDWTPPIAARLLGYRVETDGRGRVRAIELRFGHERLDDPDGRMMTTTHRVVIRADTEDAYPESDPYLTFDVLPQPT